MKKLNRTIRSTLIVQAFVLAATFAHADAGLAGDCKRVDALESYASTGVEPAGFTCETFLGLSAYTGVSCFREFTFRDDTAVRLANVVWTEITDCRAGILSEPDMRVNHPDSYDLKELTVGNDIYRVSVKDKGGEKRTLVFVRLEQKSGDGSN